MALDAKLAALNAQAEQNGQWSPGQRALADQNLKEQAATGYDAQISQAFDQGLADGYAGVTGAIKKTLAAPFNFTFASIPWQLYLALVLVIIWYAGGAVRLKNAFAK